MWYALVEQDQTTRIRDFARTNDLDMVVIERARGLRETMKLARYFAYFQGAEVKSDAVLSGEYGNGNVPEDAIANYALRISGKLLVIDAYDKEKRREIQVPELE
jgi:hypothetical protein